MRSTFGGLLRLYRQQSANEKYNRVLTQERLAKLLEEKTGILVTTATISNWERGRHLVHHTERRLLVGLIEVLYMTGGIKSLDEANALLLAGDYRHLNTEEMLQVSPTWLENPPSAELGMGSALQLLLTPPFMVPPLSPQGIVGRDRELEEVIEMLDLENGETLNVPPVTLLGMGGVGKTTLAIAISRSQRVLQYFSDGVLWVTLGPMPLIRPLLENWGQALGMNLQDMPNEDVCRQRLRSALFHRRTLLVVDDVWDIHHGTAFTLAGPYGRTLFTTREPDIAYNLATRTRTLRVDVLSPQAALVLLENLALEAVATDAKSAIRLCERLEFLPLALTLAGRFLANESDVPSRMHRLLDELIERKEARLNLTQSEHRLGLEERAPSLQAILGMSVDRLDKIDQERFAMLSVFGSEPLTWDIDAVACVWECSIEEAEETTARFIQRGLVEYQDGRYRMNALLSDYAHTMLVEAQ